MPYSLIATLLQYFYKVPNHQYEHRNCRISQCITGKEDSDVKCGWVEGEPYLA